MDEGSAQRLWPTSTGRSEKARPAGSSGRACQSTVPARTGLGPSKLRDLVGALLSLARRWFRSKFRTWRQEVQILQVIVESQWDCKRGITTGPCTRLARTQRRSSPTPITSRLSVDCPRHNVRCLSWGKGERCKSSAPNFSEVQAFQAFAAGCFRDFLKQMVQIASTMVASFPERPRNRPTGKATAWCSQFFRQ